MRARERASSDSAAGSAGGAPAPANPDAVFDRRPDTMHVGVAALSIVHPIPVVPVLSHHLLARVMPSGDSSWIGFRIFLCSFSVQFLVYLLRRSILVGVEGRLSADK